MRTGFEPGSAPIFEPARRQMHRTLPGIFPSKKVDGGYIRTRLPLMMDGLYHLDTDPNVAVIRPYPIRIEYASSQTEDTFRMHQHVFDLGVEMRNGEHVYIDYIPYNIQQERAWIKNRTATLQEVARRELNAAYAVHDERSIFIQPRFANLKIMWRLMHSQDDAALMAVRRAVAQLHLPTNIAAVRHAVSLPALRFEMMDLVGQQAIYQRSLDDVDRVFTALMQMGTGGEIQIDLSRPLGDQTLIFEATD